MRPEAGMLLPLPLLSLPARRSCFTITPAWRWEAPNATSNYSWPHQHRNTQHVRLWLHSSPKSPPMQCRKESEVYFSVAAFLSWFHPRPQPPRMHVQDQMTDQQPHRSPTRHLTTGCRITQVRLCHHQAVWSAFWGPVSTDPRHLASRGSDDTPSKSTMQMRLWTWTAS